MYNFEGDFRRKPIQNLAGASVQHERDELIHRVQSERQKREELRRKFNSSILIQAYARSYLTRMWHKRFQRNQFDEILHNSSTGTNAPDDLTLSSLIRKLLFFYCHKTDAARLVSISQLLLKRHENIIVAAATNGAEPWSWRLCSLLRLNMESMSAAVSAGSTESLAVSLRTLEVFTSWETYKRVLGADAAGAALTKLLGYLVRNGYFLHLRTLVDAKVPPMLEPSARAPTPLAGCLFEMIAQPLHAEIIDLDRDFSALVLSSLCQHILCPQLTDPIHQFVIPALSALPSFPLRRLLECLRDFWGTTVKPSSWLLFAVLSLEKNHFGANLSILIALCNLCLACPGADENGRWDSLLPYLQALAVLTLNISRTSQAAAEPAPDDDGSDDEADEEQAQQRSGNSDELRVLSMCVNMLNEEARVQRLLAALYHADDPHTLHALCQVCHNLLVSQKAAIQTYKLLYMLAFKPDFLRHLWTSMLSERQTSLYGGSTPLLHVISRGIPVSGDAADRIVPQLAVFCALFSLLIETLHDAEFYNDESLSGAVQMMPFALSELVPLSLTLKEVSLGLVELAFPESRPVVRDDYLAAVHGPAPATNTLQTHVWAHLFKVSVGLVRQLHARDIRRAFCPDQHWICKQVTIPLNKPSDFTLRRHRLHSYRPFQALRAFTREELEEGPPLSTKEVRTMTVLRQLPFVVPFQQRVLVFQNLVLQDKMVHQGERSHFLQGPNIQLAVRRDYLYEDAFDKLSVENEPELRLKMRVQLVNAAGLDEAGVDGGGIFREFLSELLKTAFDPNRGFFRITKDNMLYPNPNVHLLLDNFPKHYFFIGRVLGKALYENLLVELPMAEFFLIKLVGRHSSIDVHHLASLDPLLYRNLLFLKTYDGDVSDLGLDFTMVNDELGETRVDELKPGGAAINVDSRNRIEYIHLMADYKLNRQIRAQCSAFKQGLASVIPLEWLQMFNNKELQVLISGAEIPVDVTDLRLHTNYTGGYTPDHETIKVFWKVVENFTDLQRRQLLKFVTSCSRPPLLGFKELDPPFCIQHAGSIDRLPTASTCMNLLKLPEFPTEPVLTEKLLYAIQAGAGFELS